MDVIEVARCERRLTLRVDDGICLQKRLVIEYKSHGEKPTAQKLNQSELQRRDHI